MAHLIVREILKVKGISIKELASMLSISPSAASQLLANPYPSTQVLQRIADAIGVDIIDFFAQGKSYINGFLEFKNEVYSIKSRWELLQVIDKVDGIAHLKSFRLPNEHKMEIMHFISTSIKAGHNNAMMARYGVNKIFTLTYDAQSKMVSLTLCIGDGKIEFKTYDVKNYEKKDNFTDPESTILLESILAEIERIDKEGDRS